MRVRCVRHGQSLAGVSGGTGKTTLAVHWAHRIAGRFPDGQLYVNLRGFDPTGQVMDPADAIRGFLDALGVAPERIPSDLDAQAALYRSTLRAKRMLVVLDNARDADQVRPLLPGDPACQVIVTSRNDLLGLVTKEGARPLIVDVLTDAEARQLLGRRLGAERTAAESEAVDQIIETCARLPLALAVVAARAAVRPGFPLAGLTDALAGDDPETDVRAVFSWSYRQLSPQAQRLFRLLGLHPGPDISAPAAASLFGARPPLDELTRAHLLDEHAPGRYTFHDLLRAYARDLAGTTDTDEARDAAAHRMLDHYLHSAHSANRRLTTERDPITLAEPGPGVAPEQPADVEQAMAWFAAEHQILLAVLDAAGTRGFDVHAWKLAWSLVTFLDRQAHWHGLAAATQAAVRATQRLNDKPALIRAHRNLALAYTRLGRLEQAHAELRRSLDLAREQGDVISQARAHFSLAMACEQQGRYPTALQHAERSLDLFRTLDHQRGKAMALNGVGWFNALLGRHEAARIHCEQALALYQELGNVHGAAETWDSLGYTHHQAGRLQQAVSCYQYAVDMYRGLGARHAAAGSLTRLGHTWQDIGNPVAARESWEEALAIYDELGHSDADGVRAELDSLDRSPPRQ